MSSNDDDDFLETVNKNLDRQWFDPEGKGGPRWLEHLRRQIRADPEAFQGVVAFWFLLFVLFLSVQGVVWYKHEVFDPKYLERHGLLW